MGGDSQEKIGLKKKKAWWSLENLTFNFCATYIFQVIHWPVFNLLIKLHKM